MKAVKYILITAVVVFAAGGKMKADDFEPRIRDGVKFLGEVKIKFQPRYDLGGIAENYLAIWDWESYLNLARLVDSDPVRAAKLLDKFDDGEEKFAVIQGTWSAREESYIAFWKEASRMDLGDELIEFGVLPVRGWNGSGHPWGRLDIGRPGQCVPGKITAHNWILPGLF